MTQWNYLALQLIKILRLSNMCRLYVRRSTISLALWQGTETMLLLYKAFILPHFSYCSMVWHFSSKQDSDKLDLLNKRILRFIFKDFNSEYNNLLKRAGTANLRDKRLQNMIPTIFNWCIHFSDYLVYLKDMFRLRSSTYFLRGHNMLCLPKPLTTSYGINSFSYLAAKSWNSLPDHYRTITDFTSFRRLISTWNKWFCIFFFLD